MKILVINCGSSSLKYQLIDMENENALAKGLVERIGIEGSILTQKSNGEKYIIEQPMKDHKDAIKLVLDALVDSKHGVISDMSEISAVGHRVVHGGEKYAKSVLIDDEVMKSLEDCIKLAPLHNPPNIIGINACKALMPNTSMVAVFDTAFHQTIPEYAYIYPIPYELYKKYGIRKYGFHGTSHRYVSRMAAEMMGKDIKDLKIITCHLGNGASICAVDGGKSVETSMGFTPLEGVAMGTRSGSIDPAIITFLMKELNLTIDEVNNLINKKSGVYGISGVSSDFRDIETAAEEGKHRSKLALDVFHYKVKRFIGSYAAAMGGVDCVVFTAGLGENAPLSRAEICNGLEFLGIKIDDKKNNEGRGFAKVISTDDSKVKVFVIPTDEELMIARDTEEIVE
ncbi:acetate kinase [Clostridium tetanomorphum]|uniref:Acetate kinase n=1 Tax=Clostridium tetanomorphum TaxID=1553 RepID=A0A923ECN2_CLOTT|nr:acetate kinase [Clostridium tetanomorphum]KAJ51528.1 acetate kinase A/propionate kinase 2 [Clostridium tetanomorphum DSM 665]MBC2398881.1 acetate kinase [Clostridium tetanomorphum]MBP1865176.1 acetate kinase [Clostridium tetanomorphum]NRS84685.1 acetate kinase [Clostridium tetanomorphum]NRZ97900.1 acetate kinase [Clostridium tetanomorphum]